MIQPLSRAFRRVRLFLRIKKAVFIRRTRLGEFQNSFDIEVIIPQKLIIQLILLLKYCSSRESRGKRQRYAVRATLDSHRQIDPGQQGKAKQSFPSAFPARETPDETGVGGQICRRIKKRPIASVNFLTFFVRFLCAQKW